MTSAPLRASDADLAMVRDTLVRGDLSAEGAQNLYPRHASLLLGEVMFLRRQVMDARQTLATLPIELAPAATLPDAVAATTQFFQDYQEGLWQQQEVARVRKLVQRRTEERDQRERALQEAFSQNRDLVAAAAEDRQRWLDEKAALEQLVLDHQRQLTTRTQQVKDALAAVLASETASIEHLLNEHRRETAERLQHILGLLALVDEP